MVKTKEEQGTLFFVQVRDPNEVRRNALEILKNILETLQRFEKFKHIRQEKLESMQKLRNFVKDVNKMMSDLRSKLPQTNLRAVDSRETPKKSKKVEIKKKKKTKAAEQRLPEKKPAQEQKQPKKEMTDLEKLEAQLGAIEGKLKSLT